jgi:hypothetical protein
MIELSLACGGSSYNERTVGYSLSDAFVFLSVLQQSSRPHGGFRFTESQGVWIHHPQTPEAKIAHGPRNRANIQRIACGDKNNDNLTQ